MDILELVKKYGAEIAEDKQSEFNSEFRKAFKSAAELKKVKDDLAELQTELDAANETIEKHKKSSESANENEKKYKDELEGYKKQLADLKFDNLLSDGLKGIEFANDRVKASVIAEIKGKKFEEKEGKLTGLADYLKDLYTKEPDTFKAVDSDIHTWGESQKNNGTKEVKESPFGLIL